MPFLIGNELAIFTVPGIQQKLGLDINMVGILFHEAFAGYFTLHLQLFIILWILRGMMDALRPGAMLSFPLNWFTWVFGNTVCKLVKYSHSRSAREQNDQGLIFSSDETASPWSFAPKETNLNQRAATEMYHLLIDFYKYVMSCSFRYSQLKRNNVWRYWLHFPTYSS